jgi:hypothetical protein
MNRGRACAVALVLAFAGGAFPRVVLAQPRPAAKPLAQALGGQAKADYEAGRTLAGDGDFAGALIKFQSAYDASKDPRLLWNVAFCDKNLRHYAKVVSTLQRYLVEGTGVLTDKDRKEAQDLIATIQPFTTSATIKVDQDGAQIFVDDALVGASPLSAPVVLDIGERRLRVTKDGFKPFEKTMPVGGSAAVAVDVTLEVEVHQGRLVVNAPPDASLTLDDKPIGQGKVDLNIATGGHQLRATAPGMRPYQTEVVVQDNETRQLDVMLEKALGPERPKLRIAVGCDGPEPRGPEDGLVVYLDGPDALPPLNVKKRWDDAQSRNIVEYVEYAVDAGTHTVRARIPDCQSLETSIVVDAQNGATVTGALESDTAWMLSGAQGIPGRFRLGAGLWMVGIVDHIQTKEMPEAYAGSFGAANGFSLEAGMVWRWFDMYLGFDDAWGSVQRWSFNTHDTLPASTPANFVQATYRMSFRIPFHDVSWDVLGPEAGIGRFDVKDVSVGDFHGVLGGGSGISVQPFCDFGASARAAVLLYTDAAGSNNPVLDVSFGVFWEPNEHCRRVRDTTFELRAGEAAK